LKTLLTLPRPVWLLGWVSFFTDTASEIVYPLLPIFLTRVLGASAMSLGVIEGIAEAANSVLKIWSGRFADKTGAPKRLVLAGYGLSSAVRPLIAITTGWMQVLCVRFVDRLGKGIRGAPRDAMLAGFAGASNRGLVYGFHRAMDHAGAVLGPLIASLFLYLYPGEYRTLFALTIVPGVIVMIVLAMVPEAKTTLNDQLPTPNPDASKQLGGKPSNQRIRSEFHPDVSKTPLGVGSWKLGIGSWKLGVGSWWLGVDANLWRAVFVILIFSLGNASDAFLLLRLSDLGVATFWIPLLWSALHVVKSTSSVAGGQLSDRLGRRHVIALGWMLYAAVYAAFAVFNSTAIVISVFLIYGLYFGLTEGVEKAWVADLAATEVRGTAFGVYNAVLGLGSLAASLLFGAIWTRVSPPAAFFTGAGLAALATILLYAVGPRASRPS
jgi:MFS family permease